MKSKKFAVASAFILGTLVFVSAAFADMAIGSGYDSLKNSIKHTTAFMESGLNSYTADFIITLKNDGSVATQETSYMKVDNLKQAYEETTTRLMTNGQKTEYYRYSDAQTNITKNTADSKFYVTEFNGSYKNSDKAFKDPFRENGAAEFEKVVDAVVGSLKNYVQAEEKSDGGVEYSGSLNEAQIPAIANAVSAFVFKTNFANRNMGINTQFTDIEKDIFIRSVTGKALENKNGIIENVAADVVVQGVDKNGVVRVLEIEAVLKVSNINSTVVVTPELTGKEIVKNTASKYVGIDDRYAGNYKNDIIIEKDGRFLKIGERNLIIAHADDKTIAGRYYETVLPGYESLMPAKYDFTFDYNPNGNTPEFTYKNPQGNTEYGHLGMGGPGKLYLSLNIKQGMPLNPNIYFDGEFIRIFE